MPKPFLDQVNYIYLFKYTKKGAEALSLSPSRVKGANEFVKNIHAFCEFISLSGDFDMMTFFRGTPEEAYQLLLYLKSLGTVKVKMVRIETRSLAEYSSLLTRTLRPARSRKK